MLELRTYTLASDAGLDQYASVHWARHISSLAKFGIKTHRIFKQVGGDKPRLVALVEYSDGDDPKDVTERYMSSPEFRADMDGFPRGEIVDVSTVYLKPASTDPGTDAS